MTGIKFTAFYFTHSTAVLSDAAESIMNIVASLFALFSVRLSSKPKDLNHPYGHGKVEFFALGFEGALILVTGILVFYKATLSFLIRPEVHAPLWGAILIGSTGLANWILGNYLIKKSKTLHSITLYAEGKHLLSDTLSSFAIVIGLIIIYYTHYFWLDGLISIVVSLWMLVNGYSLVRRSVAGLMDEADMKRVQEIINLFSEHRTENWIDIHNLRAQTYGESIHIDGHLTLPYYFDLKQTDGEFQHIKEVLQGALSTEVELFLQADPCDPECCHYCRKENCPVRSEKKSVDIVWDYKRLVLNQKHYLIP